MTRTIVSLPEADKRWLIKVGKENHKSMTAVIRDAVAFYRKSSKASLKPKSFQQALESSFGKGKGYFGNSAEYVRRLRDEWK